MEKITVPFITGDGVGAEVTPSMQAVVNAAVKKSYGDIAAFHGNVGGNNGCFVGNNMKKADGFAGVVFSGMGTDM